MRRPLPRRTVEAALLAAIHACAALAVPRLRRVVPVRAQAGDPVILVGEGLAGGELRAVFGAVATWAVALSDQAALAVVPTGAAAGPLTLLRRGIRSNSLVFGGPPDEVEPSIVRIDPADGALGVFRDTPVVARVSHPLDPASLTPDSFSVASSDGPAPGVLRLSPDAEVVIWTPERPLVPGRAYFVRTAGLLDRRGRAVLPHLSRFVPCALSWADMGG